MPNTLFNSLFYLDPLAKVMTCLVAFLGLSVARFSYRYMDGDSNYRRFFIVFGLLIASVIIMVSSDHILLLLGAWCLSNSLLTLLMAHKSNWNAAKASSALAAKYHFIGALSIASGLFMLYQATGKTSIQAILGSQIEPNVLVPALACLLVGAMTQSALYPFHKWLISSLNSPTPVSAIMHAGLVNGGGFLLARFAPLYIQSSTLLDIIFAIGMLSALLGTLWKLLQSDIKRMLACSTMGQMGFMLAQCGLGLFAASVTHIVWHGMFKAYLFLASGTAAQEKRHTQNYPPKPLTFIYAMLCGVAASYCLSVGSGKAWLALDTTVVLFLVAFLTGTQLAIPLLDTQPTRSLPFALTITCGISLLYGLSVYVISNLFLNMGSNHPQPLKVWHVAAMALLSLAWLFMLFAKKTAVANQPPKWLLKGYVAALNASQPHPATITSHRTLYY